MLFVTLFVIAVTVSVYAFYNWATANADYFRKKGLKYIKLTSLDGNIGAVTLRKYLFSDFMQRVYGMFPNEKIFGLFDFRKPIYVLRDPETIKMIGVKYFNHFVDRRPTLDLKSDPTFFNVLLNIEGDKWRQMRASLTPAFTGSKIRLMYDLMADSLDQSMAKLKKNASQQRNYEFKDLFTRIGSDANVACTVGDKVNSFDDSSNVYHEILEGFLGTQRFKKPIKHVLLGHVRWFAELLKIKVGLSKNNQKLKTMILDIMNYRKDNNIIRPDAFHMLMQLRSHELTLKQINEQEKDEDTHAFSEVSESNVGTKTKVVRKWTDDEVVAQCFLFFVGGIETTIKTLAFMAYELALNPDIQLKLCAEIDETVKKCGKKRIDYNSLQQMKYLDQIFSETLRKYPSASYTDRRCVSNVEINCGSTKVLVEEGSVLWIPFGALHHDPEYFPNPEKFNPERFSDENKHKIVPGTYLPFGIGPRNCMGARLALMEVKGIIVFLLQHFSLETNEKTEIPLKFQKALNTRILDGGVHLNLKPRL